MNNAMTLLELNQLVAETLEGAFPDTYWVQGELSEGRVGYGGHFYGELVERRVDSPKGRSQGAELVAKARVNCWQNIFARVSAKFARATGESLRPGMKVLVEVSVSFHELYGYSLTIQDIVPMVNSRCLCSPSVWLWSVALRQRDMVTFATSWSTMNMGSPLM